MFIIDVLTALAVVVAIALIFGILLALCISLFGVKEDEKTKQIRAALPGINCGACGFKGCNDYAAAIASGAAKPNLCVPGAESTTKELSELLGVEVEEIKDVIAFVQCNGSCGNALKKAVYDGVQSCKACSAMYGGDKACNYGCIGCGECASVCISHAITMIGGVAVVDTSKCLGCGLCTKTCPKKLITMIPQEAAVAVYCNSKDKGADARKACKNACIGCKKCEKACPNNAITVIDNCAKIDYSKCSGCGACAEGCPTGCLKKAVFPDIPEDFVCKI